ncbi:uncharacterized protein LOC129941838 [Eupeodes corollae]|uniref:uncharacterized protein LOC129941838 n=1 Tax=Eupeodes corollae TaxID=290404 RepID=UPI002490F404|nr:uncharacterized protein LOC129941838 [Eupeodes corollae]
MQRVFLLVLLFVAIVPSTKSFVSNFEWQNFKIQNGKTYKNIGEEGLRRMFYGTNKIKIENFNRVTRGTFRLGVNQFSDLTLLEYALFFAPTADIQSNGVPYTAPTVHPPSSFLYTAQGFTSPVRNQGLVCNSGWAYAVATTLQIYYASTTGNLNSQTLSAQNIIDCAGGYTACRRQVPQTAFDYLTKQSQKLFTLTEYSDNPLGTQGMCAPPANSNNGKTLKSYSNIPDGNDELLKSVLNYVSPVVIKLNPATFEFMHYKEGVFTQPTPILKADHYVTVVGYESAQGSSQGVWFVQNSFGTTWGENGMMRIEMNSDKPISKSAVFPLN